jgi:hypothetical protein
MRGQQRQRAAVLRNGETRETRAPKMSRPRPWGEVEGDMRGVMGGDSTLQRPRGERPRSQKTLVRLDGTEGAAEARFVDGIGEPIEEALARMRARALKPFVRMHRILPCRAFTPATCLTSM